MRILALMIITGGFLVFLFLAISFGVAMGIILEYETLKKKDKENVGASTDGKRT